MLTLQHIQAEMSEKQISFVSGIKPTLLHVKEKIESVGGDSLPVPKEDKEVFSSLTIQEELKAFSLASKTPLETMEFIASLQRKIMRMTVDS